VTQPIWNVLIYGRFMIVDGDPSLAGKSFKRMILVIIRRL
jgi:hypothetical protein